MIVKEFFFEPHHETFDFICWQDTVTVGASTRTGIYFSFDHVRWGSFWLRALVEFLVWKAPSRFWLPDFPFGKFLCSFLLEDIAHVLQSWKTFHLRVFVFSNYRNWNNGNLLLESGEILKQKWHKTTKNSMSKLTYIKALWKYPSSIASTACHYWELKSNVPKT